MTRLFLSSTTMVCMIVLSATLALASRSALIIGNSNYLESPLGNTVNDARDMRSKLEQLGFSIIYSENATLREMEMKFNQFLKRLEYDGGVGLFYYAGHAFQINGVNYLLPIDFDMNSNFDNYIKVDKIAKQMKDSGSNFSVVILDACRTNPINDENVSLGSKYRAFRGIKVRPKTGLAVLDAPPSTFIAYSTAPDQVALDGSGRNGIYTKHLLRHIDTKGISIEEVFKKTSAGVLSETNYEQVPWTSSSITQDFYFNGKPKVTGSKRRVFGAF